MEQVRELLMGTQLKDMENRILRQEERFMQEIADLRDTVKNRVESLENFMKSESSSLLHRLQEEKTERAAAIKNEQRERAETIKAEHKERAEAIKQDKRERDDAVAQVIKDMVKKEENLERKLAALSSTFDTAEQELRRLLLAESARLSAATEEKYKDALSALSRTAAQLRHDLVSRAALSGLFTENAVTLAGDVSLSEGDKTPSGVKAKADKTAAGS
jgi:uncharacterized membrane-anchored protein YhcB (DUF1043 family)